jgi:Xaa-Pro dipeptidase
MWTKTQIKQHIKVAKILLKIKDLVFDYTRKNKSISEHEVQQFIINKFKEFDLKTSKHPPIVAFRQSTANIHYYPKKNKSRKMSSNSLIMIDIWARLNQKRAPFADITWMAYYGSKIPKNIQKVFNIIKETRDLCVDFIRKELKKGKMPVGREISKITIDNIKKRGFQGKMNHYTGHSLGYVSPHGNRKGIRPSNNDSIHKNYGYTIEPGIYLKNKFGVRSEIDFYITKKKKLIITTDVQKRIVKMSRTASQ